MSAAGNRGPDEEHEKDKENKEDIENKEEGIKDDEEPAAVEQIMPAIDIDDASDDEETKTRKRKEECKSLAKLIGSNTALIVIVAGYCAIGGAIFAALEIPNEVATCKSTRDVYQEALQKAVKRIDFLSSNLQLSDYERSEKYSETMEQLRIDFQDSSWDTRDCDNMVPLWSWMGSFFFCLTVVSTIGYGNIAPVTPEGRVVVMFYALIGLPIMVMTLASVGNVLAQVFKWLYNVLCCCGCCVHHRKARVRIKPPAIMWRINAEGKPVGDGPSVIAEDSESELDDENEVNIPLTVSLLVIAMSLIMGAVIFSAYEDWTFLDAAYYSFVSLSTIGFGDLSPDFSDATSPKVQGKMVVTLFGMALVSMCLQMMQDEVGNKITWLSTKMKADKEAEEKARQERQAQKEEEEEADEEADEDEEEDERPTTGRHSARPRTGLESARPRTGSARPSTGRNAVSPYGGRAQSTYRE